MSAMTVQEWDPQAATVGAVRQSQADTLCACTEQLLGGSRTLQPLLAHLCLPFQYRCAFASFVVVHGLEPRSQRSLFSEARRRAKRCADEQ